MNEENNRLKRIEDFHLNGPKVAFEILDKLETLIPIFEKLSQDDLEKLIGADGKTPVKGVDYLTDRELEELDKFIQDTVINNTVTLEEILQAVKPEIAKLKPKDGKDGHTPTRQEILDIILSVKDVFKGKDGKTLTGDEIIDKIKEASKKLHIKDLNGSRPLLRKITKLQDDIENIDKKVYITQNHIEEQTQGSSTFKDLTDTPADYSGQAGKVVTVKSDESGLEYTSVTDTDEKVKASATDTAGYLDSKVDGGTIEVSNDKLKVKDGVYAGVSHPHTASDISDFDTAVSNNSDVSANTNKRHNPVTVTDTDDIDLTLTGQDIKGDLKATAISSKTSKTVTGVEELLINDGGTLKKTTAQAIADLGSGGGVKLPLMSIPTVSGGSNNYIYERIFKKDNGNVYIMYSYNVKLYIARAKTSGNNLILNSGGGNSLPDYWYQSSYNSYSSAQLNTNDNYLFFKRANQTATYRIDVTTKTIASMSVSGAIPDSASEMFSDGTYLYYIKSGETAIKKYSVSGTTLTYIETLTAPITIDYKSNTYNTPFYAKGFLYWIDHDEKKLYKMNFSTLTIESDFTSIDAAFIATNRYSPLGGFKGMFEWNGYIQMLFLKNDSEDDIRIETPIIDDLN